MVIIDEVHPAHLVIARVRVDGVCSVPKKSGTSIFLLFSRALIYVFLRRHPQIVKMGAGVLAVDGAAAAQETVHRKYVTRTLWVVYLLRVTPTDIDPREPFEAEFRVQNTGFASIEVPVSPHLSDLQPDDESVPFSYLSIALVVSGESQPQRPLGSSVGFVALYGSTAHERSVLVLKPGEWIGVRANVKLRTRPAEPSPARFRGTFWSRGNTFRPHPRVSSTESQNLYPNETRTPSISVYLHPARSEDPSN